MVALSIALVVLASPVAPVVGAAMSDSVLVCLPPATATNGAAADPGTADAARQTLASYLTGPTLGSVLTAAKLATQAREEAKRSGCRGVVFVTVKLVHAAAGGNPLLGKLATKIETQVYRATTRTNALTRDAAREAAGAARDLARSVKSKDELTLEYRLESLAGAVVVKNSTSRKAGADGEDLLTPLLEGAAEAVAGAVAALPPG